MASKAVVDAVMARLGATWSGISVVGPNTTEEAPAGGDAFILVQFPVSRTSRPPVNQRTYREEGAFRVIVHGARGEGTANILTWCDGIATLFRDQSFSGVETLVPDAPFVDDESGNYAMAAIVCPYRYQFNG